MSEAKIGFKITQRHYDIIIKQVQDNFPYESGGFVGGNDYFISAIFPTFNKDHSNKTDVFSISRDDIERAHLFFEKHGLTYYGAYHSHPKGAAIPSEQDLKNIQNYLFIISLRDFDNPDFAAYKVTGIQKADRVPLTILSNSKFDVKDIHGGGKKSPETKFIMPDYEDQQLLNNQIHQVFEGDADYKKQIRTNDDGDFSTLA